MSYSAPFFRQYPDAAKAAVAGAMLALLVACGGGGDSDGDSVSQPSAAPSPPAPAPVPDAQPHPTAPPEMPPPREAIPEAPPEPADPAAIPAPPVAPEAPAESIPPTAGSGGAGTLSNADAVGTARALGASASLSVAGISEVPPPASPPAGTGGGRSFHVDSRSGNDASDGRSASAGAGGSGPWKTLARVMLSDIGAGDALVLACGSEWRETLRLPADGTVTRPLLVTAPHAGCDDTAPPTIDGSIALPPDAWTLQGGSIYSAALDARPLQLSAAGGRFDEAHHPNRGHRPADPASPYLALAADGDSVSVGGRLVSTSLSTGPDLVLPPGAQPAVGTRVRIRTNSWTLDERTIGAVDGTRLTLDRGTSYPVGAGWGYFMLGERWMLDSPGEWHHEAGRLDAWMPDSAAPAQTVFATVQAIGIDLAAHEHVVVDGIAVRRVGTGVDLRRSRGLLLRNLLVEDTAGAGADVAGSSGATIESSRWLRTGSDGIGSNDADITPATGLTVRNNLVRDSAVQMQGERSAGLPVNSRAAILAGERSRVTGNAVINAGHVGVHVRTDSVVENNFVYGACSVLDDCAGIYTWNSSGVHIRANTVVRSRGAVQGKAAAVAFTQAQGIYLDESTRDSTVQDNTVIDADHGIQLHVAHGNLIRGNRLYANRGSQIRLHESRNRDNAAGDLHGNVIEGNLVAAVHPQSVGLLLQTRFASTARFGRFDHNRYYDRAAATVAVETTAAGSRAFDATLWQRSSQVGSSQAVDANGGAVSGAGFAAYAVTGGNLVPNSGLLVNAGGWTHWNASAPAGQLLREACASGICLRYVAGGSAGLVASAGFPLQQGQWYRFSVDLAIDADQQPLQLSVRRVAANGNGLESVTSAPLSLTAGRHWTRHTLLLQSTRSLVVGDPASGERGARIDIGAIPAGRTLSLANMELVPVSPEPLAQVSGVLVNVGSTPVTVGCPHASSHPALCEKFVILGDDQPVGWPLALAAHSATIVYAQEPALLDTDRDGIADIQDRCPGTPAGLAVDAGGCPWPYR